MSDFKDFLSTLDNGDYRESIAQVIKTNLHIKDESKLMSNMDDNVMLAASNVANATTLMILNRYHDWVYKSFDK